MLTHDSLLTDACRVAASAHVLERWRTATKKPRLGGRGSSVRSGAGQPQQPPPDLEPSVLNEDPHEQLLTAFGLLIAKPEPISEST
jgi:hypothetical protein